MACQHCCQCSKKKGSQSRRGKSTRKMSPAMASLGAMAMIILIVEFLRRSGM